jgi:hypothetical protein
MGQTAVGATSWSVAQSRSASPLNVWRGEPILTNQRIGGFSPSRLVMPITCSAGGKADGSHAYDEGSIPFTRSNSISNSLARHIIRSV